MKVFVGAWMVISMSYILTTGDASALDCKCDQINPRDREGCSDMPEKVNEASCVAAGCCWNRKVRGVHWCFNKSPIEIPDLGGDCEFGMTDPDRRMNCAWPGIKEDVCTDCLRCCWNTARNVPHCYHKNLD